MSELQIGQSLTPEQVRDLPDGAKVLLDWGIMYKDVFTAPIQNTMTGENGRIAVMLLSIAGWHSATLVSLPTAEPQPDPSPGEGYRWLAPEEDAIAVGDQCKVEGGWKITGRPVGDRIIAPYVYRRRIEPQADPEPTPCASSEIEKRAAWALLHAEIVDLHRGTAPNGIEYDCPRIVGMCRKVIEAESYASSIGGR